MPHNHRHSAAAVALLCIASLLLLAPQADAGCGTLAPTQTGGDGFIPVLGPDFRIYNTYHHQSAKVQCSDPFTGTTCAGYSSTGIDLDSAGYLPTVNWVALTGLNFQSTMLQNNNAGVAFRCLDSSDPKCFHLLIATSYLMSNNKYLFGITCYDVTTSKLCSTNPVTILNPSSVYGTELVFGGIHSFEKYNNKAYSVDSGMNLLCFDLVNSVSCPGFPSNILKPILPATVPGVRPGQGHDGAVINARYLNYNGRPSLYVVVAYNSFNIAETGARVACVDLNTMGLCSEFAGSAQDISTGAATNAFDFFFEYDSNANPISVCYYSLFANTVASCRSLANPAIVTGAATIALLRSVTSNIGMVHQTYFNNRMYFGTYSNKGIFCIDFSKASGPVACPNFPVIETALSGSANTHDYGVSVDFAGECLFALGDASYLYSFDSLGNVPCAVSTPPYVAPDLYLVPDKSTVLLNVLSNDANFNAASLKITSAPAGTATIVSNRIQFTPVQNVDTFTYRVCSPGFGPATASTTVTVKICPDQSDTDGDGIVNCFDLDDDNDGILDTEEGFADSDGDGIQNSLDLDSDNDGIPDYIENLRRNPTGPSSSKPSIGGIALDADGDGKIDGPVGANGIPDKIETSPDSGSLITPTTRPDFDGDGIPDNVDLDSDNDGILDSVEGSGDFDNDGYPNYLDLDSDGDGICDLYENLANGPAAPNPQNAAIGSYAMDANKDCVLDDTNGDNKITLADVGKNGIIDTVETFPDSGVLLPRLSHPDSDKDGQFDFLDVDSDNDGVPDLTEGNKDSDKDGIPDFRDTDSDGDGVPDTTSGGKDTDGDGIPDRDDLDDDNDGILDVVEGTGDFDGDGIPNYLDLDSDGDGICDLIENLASSPAVPSPTNPVTSSGYVLDANKDCVLDDTNGDGVIDSKDVGTNGVINLVETSVDSGTLLPALNHPDTDKDGSPDFLDVDSDNDGIPDLTEGSKDTDKDGIINSRDLDSDGDGITDNHEGTKDIDKDGIPNYLDPDSDGDGITDKIEGEIDTDGDGVPNYKDIDSDNDGILDTTEKNIDTDGDGVPDYLDLDSDDDGSSDLVESGSSNPDGRDHYTGPDTDGDGLVDEVDRNPTNFGGPANYPLRDSDGDKKPDYVDVDTANVLDADKKSNLDPTIYDHSTGKVTGPDSDGDGIKDSIDDCVCFGGLHIRRFTVVTPTTSAWFMYDTNPISWKHNLDLNFNKLKVELVSVGGKARYLLRDQYDIGANDESIISFSTRFSKLSVGNYYISFGVYSTDGSFSANRFLSSTFPLKTGQSN